MGSAFLHGWVSLPTAGEILLEHGVPVAARVSADGLIDVERMADEIAEISGLDVTLGPWQPLDESDQVQADLHVDAREIREVLRRLALVSADTFFDRYRKAIAEDDVDYEDEAYAHDFGIALNACGLRWNQADPLDLRGEYLQTLHSAAEEKLRHPE